MLPRMAKRRHSQAPKKRATPSTSLPTVAPTVMPTLPESKPIAKGRIRRVVERIGSSLIDSAVDRAFGLFLLGVFAIVTPIAIAIWLYVKSGRATWVYPYLYFALGCAFMCLVLIAAASVLFYVQARRRKALERSKNRQFVSHEKGFLDHIVNQKKGFKDFNSTLIAMGKEIADVGKTTSRATKRIGLAKRFLGLRAANIIHRIASNTAAKMNKHSAKMEERLTKLQETTDLLIESNVGYLNWFTPETDEQLNQLSRDRQSLVTLHEITAGALVSIEGFRDSQNSIRGMSQEMNTAINRMVHVTTGVIAFMHKADEHWEELIEIMDRKLSL
jgi:hypothetical protein